MSDEGFLDKELGGGLDRRLRELRDDGLRDDGLRDDGLRDDGSGRRAP